MKKCDQRRRIKKKKGELRSAKINSQKRFLCWDQASSVYPYLSTPLPLPLLSFFVTALYLSVCADACEYRSAKKKKKEAENPSDKQKSCKETTDAVTSVTPGQWQADTSAKSIAVVLQSDLRRSDTQLEPPIPSPFPPQ